MTTELETLEEQAEKLRNAVRALASLDHDPQERLDRALSYFVRTFRNPPDGEAHEHYRNVYAAIGDPPVGTSISVALDSMTVDERQTLCQSLLALHDLVGRAWLEAAQAAATDAADAGAADPIPEGRLESLIPGRAHDRDGSS